MQKIHIFDTTLRDGEQVPGAKLNGDEKLEIAIELEKLGVDIIEAGFPISSPSDFLAVQRISERLKNTTICALCRGLDNDIEVAYNSIKKAQDPCINTFVPVSDIHINNQIKKDRKYILEMIDHAVSKAKSFIDNVEFSAMDASRADITFLIDCVNHAIKAGAKVINIPDTVGYALPSEWRQMLRELVIAVPELKDDIILSVHVHDDLGLATANTLVGIEEGARQIEVTVNGIGERAGNCALEEIVMILSSRLNQSYETNINTRGIINISRLVSDKMGIPVQPNKAIVGGNAFAHSSGVHQDGVIKNRANFEIINPEDVGLERSQIVLTARSGRAALLYRLNSLGFAIEKEQIDEIYKRFLVMADDKKEITDDLLKELIK